MAIQAPPVTVQEVLFQAADLLEKNGWTQHAFVDDEGKHCVLGAIDYVAFGLDTESLNYHARSALQSCIERPVVEWNDAPTQTAENVINKLRSCAEAM